MTISEKIRTQRKRLGLSQEKLGEALYVSRQAITKWENGSSMPDSDKITMLANYFGVSTDYLLKEDIDVPEEISMHTNTTIPPTKNQWLRKIGIAILSISVFSLFVLWFVSVRYPVSYMDWDGSHIKGFWGFIEIYNLWFEILMIGIFGFIGIMVVGIDFAFNKYKNNRKKNVL